MACWICTLGSAYSSTFDENSAIRYFQAFVNGLAMTSAYLRVRHRPPPGSAAGALASPHRGTGRSGLPPTGDDIGDLLRDPSGASLRGYFETRPARLRAGVSTCPPDGGYRWPWSGGRTEGPNT